MENSRNNQLTSKKRIGVYPGSFDPITNGHLDIIKRASKLFDEVIVLVAYNSNKSNNRFSVKERVEMISDAIKDLNNVRCDSYSGLTIDFAKKNNAKFLIRGLRVVSDFDYEWSMFNDAFEQVFNIYIQNGEYSPETEAQFLKVPSHKQSYIEALLIPSTNRLDSSKIHDTVMQVGKVLLLDFGDYDYNKLLQLYCDYLDEKTYTDMDMKIAHVFVFLTAIYQKYQQTNGFFGWEEALVNTTQAVYNTYVRPDMLKLYELFHEKKRIKSNSIRIEYNNEVINLDNFDNWFMNMITPYLDKYLGVSSLEEAQEELDRDYPNKGKRGRKKSNPVFDFILWRASKILELSSFATPNVQINKSQADFLLKYLNFLGLLEEDSLKNDALNLRATLNNLKKNPPCFSWWNIPSDKQSPNNPLDKNTKAW